MTAKFECVLAIGSGAYQRGQIQLAQFCSQYA